MRKTTLLLILLLLFATNRVKAMPFDFDGVAGVSSNDFILLDHITNNYDGGYADYTHIPSPLSSQEIRNLVNAAFRDWTIDVNGDGEISNIDGRIALLYNQTAAFAEYEPAVVRATLETNLYFGRRNHTETFDHLTELIEDTSFDVDGDSDVDSNDTSLINILINGASDADIDANKGSSALSAETIRNNINELYHAGKLDVDGTHSVNSVDTLALHSFTQGANANDLKTGKLTTALKKAKVKNVFYRNSREGEVLKQHILGLIGDDKYDINEDGAINFNDGILMTYIIIGSSDQDLNNADIPNLNTEAARAKLRKLYFNKDLDFNGDLKVDYRDGLALGLAAAHFATSSFTEPSFQQAVENSNGLLNFNEYKPVRTAREIKDYLDNLIGVITPYHPNDASRETLADLIEARKNNSNPNIEAGSLAAMLNKILALVDPDGDGQFTRFDILGVVLKTQVARLNQNPDYDLNLDGVVDKADYSTIYSFYQSRTKGLRGIFRIK